MSFFQNKIAHPRESIGWEIRFNDGVLRSPKLRRGVRTVRGAVVQGQPYFSKTFKRPRSDRLVSCVPTELKCTVELKSFWDFITCSYTDFFLAIFHGFWALRRWLLGMFSGLRGHSLLIFIHVFFFFFCNSLCFVISENCPLPNKLPLPLHRPQKRSPRNHTATGSQSTFVQSYVATNTMGSGNVWHDVGGVSREDSARSSNRGDWGGGGSEGANKLYFSEIFKRSRSQPNRNWCIVLYSTVTET